MFSVHLNFEKSLNLSNMLEAIIDFYNEEEKPKENATHVLVRILSFGS